MIEGRNTSNKLIFEIRIHSVVRPKDGAHCPTQAKQGMQRIRQSFFVERFLVDWVIRYTKGKKTENRGEEFWRGVPQE